MPEQLLNRHDVHTSLHKARRERVPQCMPAHARNSRLAARQRESSFEINKRLAGIVIVENEVILSA